MLGSDPHITLSIFINAINDIIAGVNLIPGVNIPLIPVGPNVGYASGGVSSGGMALVGERGPELVNLPAGSQIYNARSSASRQQNELSVLIQELRDSRIDYNELGRVLRDQILVAI